MTNNSTEVARHFRTAVVPAAGMGTRFLPATKTVPKELLPVVDTPGIELVAGEAAESGAERLLIVTSPGKDGVVAHFVEDLVLESKLEAKGKYELLAKVRKSSGILEVDSVIQAQPLGWDTRCPAPRMRWTTTRMRSRCSCPTTLYCPSASSKPCRRCAPSAVVRCCARSTCRRIR